jgi:DNA-binding response OmpR family regulator
MQDESQRSEESSITVGPISVDVSDWQVSVDGKTLRLTPVESMILRFLAVHANTVCTSNQIGSSIWGSNNNYEDTSLIKMHIRHIRQKIEPNPMHPIYLLTIPEVGYTLVSHDQDETKQKTSMDADV